MKAIILAGGTGTRLWPLSRESRPKQFFDVVGDVPLIRETYRRLLHWFPAEKIYFSLSPNFEQLLREAIPEVDDDHLFLEPEKRDTGPAMGLVAALLELSDPEEPIVFIPSDHFIKDEEIFLRCLQVGEQLINETGKLLDISIEPLFPSTVLGYTKIGEKFEEREGIEIFQFAGHTEKPPFEVAKRYVESRSYLWHANYYMWTPRKFMEAFVTYSPEIGTILRKIQQCAKKEQVDRKKFSRLYHKLPKISIDYAITEHMNPQEVLIIKGDFGWSDIGAWDTLYACLSEEGYRNVIKGDCDVIDTTGTLVYGMSKKVVAVIGVENLVIVDTPDALLVCHLDSAQQVKDLVDCYSKNKKKSVL